MTEYTQEEIESRLGGPEERWLLAMVEEDPDTQVWVNPWHSKPGEKIVGLFEGHLTVDDVNRWANTLPPEWVIVEVGPGRRQMDPAVLLRAIDSGRIARVMDGILIGAPKKAREALLQNERYQEAESDRRMKILRRQLGEVVQPCRLCGKDAIPDVIMHECDPQILAEESKTG